MPPAHRPQPPILKPKTTQLTLLPTPAPPTVNRPPPSKDRGILSLRKEPRGDTLPLRDVIDYDALTATQQMRIDNGTFGAIELKEIRPGQFYYYLRWKDPTNHKRRSTYLSKDYAKAKEKLRKLIELIAK